jgi:hypothetical protein
MLDFQEEENRDLVGMGIPVVMEKQSDGYGSERLGETESVHVD